MSKITIKVITAKYDFSTECQVKAAIHNLLDSANVSNLHFSPFVPYWKSPELGELNCSLETDLPPLQLQKQFADTWQFDTADSRWSAIYLPDTTFLWICGQ